MDWLDKGAANLADEPLIGSSGARSVADGIQMTRVRWVHVVQTPIVAIPSNQFKCAMINWPEQAGSKRLAKNRLICIFSGENFNDVRPIFLTTRRPKRSLVPFFCLALIGLAVAVT